MPALFIAALMGAIASAMGSLVGRVVLALGIGFVTYSGITVAIASIRTSVIASVNGLSADALGLLGYLWMDKALTIIFSAVATSLAMRAVGGSVKRMVLK